MRTRSAFTSRYFHSALLLLGLVGGAAGVAQAAPAPCRYAIAPAGVTVPSAAGSGTFTLTTGAACRWKASVDAGFLSASPASGSGTATITVTYTENTGAVRTGRVSVKNVGFTVSQEAPIAEPPPPPPPPNEPPTADAGVPQVVPGGSLVTLLGTGSDPEGQPLSYAWTQTAGPSVSLSDPAGATPSFTAPAETGEPQALSFALVVSDGAQDSALSSVTVTVPAEEPEDSHVLSDAAAIAVAFETAGRYTIAPGTYVGNFVIAGSDITVDATGVRFEPENRYAATLTVLGSRVTVLGLTVANGAPDRDTINVGSNAITAIADLPHDVTLEQVVAEAGVGGGHRGFGLHGVGITLIDCRATGFWEVGRDSQAIWINNGPGPYTIDGGYFEGSGENMMVGGALPGILDPSGIPSDITVRGAHFFKPLAWKARPGSVKNLFELKSGKRVLVEDCLFENNWKDAQAGSAILIKADNQGGTPWMETSDVVFRHNTVRNSPAGYAVNIRATYPANPSVRVRNVVFEHNLFDGVSSGIQSGEGVDGLRVVRNTFYRISGTFLFFYGGLLADGTTFKTDLAFAGNVLHEGAYAVKGDGTASGVATLNRYANVIDFTGNVIERVNHSYTYPPGNMIVEPGTLDAILDAVTRQYPGEAGY